MWTKLHLSSTRFHFGQVAIILVGRPVEGDGRKCSNIAPDSSRMRVEEETEAANWKDIRGQR